VLLALCNIKVEKNYPTGNLGKYKTGFCNVIFYLEKSLIFINSVFFHFPVSSFKGFLVIVLNGGRLPG